MTDFAKVFRPKNYPVVPAKGTILAFHGGCFTGGSTSWDADQNHALAKLGYVVVQLWFPTTTIVEFREWAKNVNFVLQKPIHCLGRSSGGYLAKEFEMWTRLPVQKTIYICPVFKPLLRAELVPKMAEKTCQFFGNESPVDTTHFNPARELLLLAAQDENVPRQCYTKKQHTVAVYLGPVTHTGMCQIKSQTFLDCVAEFLAS